MPNGELIGQVNPDQLALGLTVNQILSLDPSTWDSIFALGIKDPKPIPDHFFASKVGQQLADEVLIPATKNGDRIMYKGSARNLVWKNAEGVIGPSEEEDKAEFRLPGSSSDLDLVVSKDIFEQICKVFHLQRQSARTQNGLIHTTLSSGEKMEYHISCNILPYPMEALELVTDFVFLRKGHFAYFQDKNNAILTTAYERQPNYKAVIHNLRTASNQDMMGFCELSPLTFGSALRVKLALDWIFNGARYFDFELQMSNLGPFKPTGLQTIAKGLSEISNRSFSIQEASSIMERLDKLLKLGPQFSRDAGLDYNLYYLDNVVQMSNLHSYITNAMQLTGRSGDWKALMDV